MANVHSKRFPIDTYIKQTNVNVGGSKMLVYCKQHAQDDNCRRCLHNYSMKGPSFNFEGSKMVAYCRQHTEDGMVDVNIMCYLHVFRTKRSILYVEGRETAAYCKQHAEDGMANVNSRRCSYDSCTKQQQFITAARRRRFPSNMVKMTHA